MSPPTAGQSLVAGLVMSWAAMAVVDNARTATADMSARLLNITVLPRIRALKRAFRIANRSRPRGLLRRLLQIGDDIGADGVVADAQERHLGVRAHLARVGDPGVDLAGVPDDAGCLQPVGIAGESCLGPGLAAEDAVQVGAQ